MASSRNTVRQSVMYGLMNEGDCIVATRQQREQEINELMLVLGLFDCFLGMPKLQSGNLPPSRKSAVNRNEVDFIGQAVQVSIPADPNAIDPHAAKTAAPSTSGSATSSMTIATSNKKLVTEGKCGTCRTALQVDGPGVVCALDTLWCADHFACFSCLQPLGNAPFYSYEGKPYCSQDYLTLFGERCVQCKDLVEGRCVAAHGRKWHVEHFNCQLCGSNMAGSTFFNRNGSVYCGACEASGKAAVAATPKACAGCNVPFSPGASVNVMQGRAYCEKDFQTLTRQMCGKCRQPIVGTCVSALNAKWHRQHFVCDVCDCVFPNNLFFERNTRPLCEKHFKALNAIAAGAPAAKASK